MYTIDDLMAWERFLEDNDVSIVGFNVYDDTVVTIIDSRLGHDRYEVYECERKFSRNDKMRFRVVDLKDYSRNRSSGAYTCMTCGVPYAPERENPVCDFCGQAMTWVED